MVVLEEVGTHLSNSKDSPGYFIGTSRSDISNKIVDIPKMRKPDVALGNLSNKDYAILAAILAATVATTVITLNFWQKRKLKKKATADLEAKKLKPTQLQVVEIENIDAVLAETSQIEATQYGVVLTSKEWASALTELLRMEAFREQAWTILARAQISDSNEQSLEWQKTIENASPEELAQKIQLAIEQNPEVMKEAEVVRILKMLGKNGPEDGPEAIGAPTR